jgi:hypothetical protein
VCCGDHSVHSTDRNEASDASVERPFQAYFERELSVLIVQRQVHEIWAGLAFENGVTNLGARVEGAREHDEDHRSGLVEHELRSD